MSDEDGDLLLIGDSGVLPCKRSDVARLIDYGYLVDNGDGTVEVTEVGWYYIATRARFG